VWRDSYKKHLSLLRKRLREYLYQAELFNMQTGGALGGSAIRVMRVMIEHFADEMTGELTPSKQQIATRLGLCVRTVANALDRLKAFGVLDWVRALRAERAAGWPMGCGLFRTKQMSPHAHAKEFKRME
jgi:hypothetical protein